MIHRTVLVLSAFVVIAALSALPPAIAQESAADGEQDFIAGSEDIPLMRDLTMVADAGMIFDSPAGRIVESFAAGETSRAAVQSFYQDSLPALGWEPVGPNRFRREGESLSIDYFGPDGQLTVRFTLAPD